MVSHYSESFRGGAAAPTDTADRETTLTTKSMDIRTNRGEPEHNVNIGKTIPDSKEGGGHRGVRMRYGNDEVKPDLMNEDAKW